MNNETKPTEPADPSVSLEEMKAAVLKTWPKASQTPNGFIWRTDDCSSYEENLDMECGPLGKDWPDAYAKLPKPDPAQRPVGDRSRDVDSAGNENVDLTGNYPQLNGEPAQPIQWDKEDDAILGTSYAKPSPAPQMPEQTEMTRKGIQIVPEGGADEIAESLNAIFKDVQSKIHDQWDWMEAHHLVECLRCMAQPSPAPKEPK